MLTEAIKYWWIGKFRSSLNIGVNVDDSSIEINNDSLRIKNSGITNDMLSGSIEIIN